MPFDGSELSPDAQAMLRAKALCTPATWFCGSRAKEAGEKWRADFHQCVATAIEDATDWSKPTGDHDQTYRLWNAFKTAIERSNIEQWNDKPERTLEEVRAAFDKAIASLMRK